MLRWVKFGGVTLGAGLVVGLGVVGWMYWHRPGSVAASEKPGTVAWGNDNALASGSSAGAGSGQTTPGLRVVSGGDQGSVQGQSVGGGGQSASTGSSGSAGTGTSGSGDGSGSGGGELPTPSQFKVYEQYKNNATALYVDVKPGTGRDVAQGSTVTVQYRGWLTNGQEFDESYARGKPYTFKEGDSSVITGFSEAMFGMKAGGQRRLIIPAAVGYGAAGKDPIPPDALMVFDVELVSVQ